MGKMILGYKQNQFTAPDIFKYDISLYAKLTYVFLQRYYVVEGEVAPSKNEIAHYLGCSKRKVDDAIKELEEVGLIQIVRRKKGPKENDTNLYIIYHPEQIEGLKLLPPYEEIKYTKKKQKPSAGDALPKNLVQEMHYPEKSSAGDALPTDEARNDADSDKNLVHDLHSTISLSLELDSIDESLSDEEIIKIQFKKHLKEDISIKQAETLVEAALQQGLSLDEVIEEIEYIAKNVKIKKTAAGTLYTSLSEGGWAKKKREQAEREKQEEQKQKHRLVRKKKEMPRNKKLPEALRMQLEGEEQQPAPVVDMEEKQRQIREKLKEMNNRFNQRKDREREKYGY